MLAGTAMPLLAMIALTIGPQSTSLSPGAADSACGCPVRKRGTVFTLCSCRWDRGKPAALDNLVLLTFEEAEAHDSTDLEQLQQQDSEYFAYVDQLLAGLRDT